MEHSVSPTAIPQQVFISYAEQDAAFLAELEIHLAPMVRKGVIAPWHAAKASPGQELPVQSAAWLAAAEIVIILISPDYLASDPLYEIELATAMRRHEQGTARVVPIMLRPFDLSGSTLASMQALPRDRRPVSRWPDRDEAWTHVIKELRLLLAEPYAAVSATSEPPTINARPPRPILSLTRSVVGPGSLICDKYRITTEIGRGGMGRVFMAERLGIGGVVAIKVLLPELSRSPEMSHRFFNEARAVNTVGHPGLVQVFDHGQLADGSAFLVMEYLTGESIGARLRQDRLSLRDSAPQLCAQIASILSAVHQSGIVHRDLKPDNVMMVKDSSLSSGERVKVLDFGIAKVARENSFVPSTRSGTILGTPEYMSPEQCRESGSVAAPADVYALGVMLYQFLTGSVPFGDADWTVVIGRQIHDAPRPLHEASPKTSRQLSDLCHRMMEKSPQQRPTMKEVAAALQGLPLLEQKFPVPQTAPPTPLLPLRGALLVTLTLVAGVGLATQLALRPLPKRATTAQDDGSAIRMLPLREDLRAVTQEVHSDLSEPRTVSSPLPAGISGEHPRESVLRPSNNLFMTAGQGWGVSTGSIAREPAKNRPSADSVGPAPQPQLLRTLKPAKPASNRTGPRVDMHQPTKQTNLTSDSALLSQPHSNTNPEIVDVPVRTKAAKLLPD